MKSRLGFLLLVLAIAFCPVVSLAQTSSGAQVDSKHARFPASRTTFQGELWLTWDLPVREWFVEAALAGYKTGYDEGCKDAAAGRGRTGTDGSKKVETASCANGGRYSNEALRYSQQMTDFYSRYPEDRDLPLAYLVRMLIGPKPKTLEEIQQWVSSVGH